MTLQSYSLLLLFVPFVMRGILCLAYASVAKELLGDKERQTDAHRSFITSMAGFSFTALMGLVVVQEVSKHGLLLPIAALTWSFLGYMSALNLQGYKFTRFRDQVSDALMESASLALLLAISLVLWSTDAVSPVKVIVSMASAFVWLVDYLIRFSLAQRTFRDRLDAIELTRKE